ncbi:MAG: DNA topoisomerase 1 [Fimbriimonadales bacterium]
MPKPLIIVESPAKTKTLKNFLGGEFELAASMGHVRDLPQKEFGVDIDNDFAPTYVPLPDREEQLSRLRRAVKDADKVYIATDPDREGEAIAWHLEQALELKDPLRIEFNEITKTAVESALAHPRTIDMRRVNAQQARRILDRLVGYKLSPYLWRAIGNRNLSAGRVQSVALRLIVEREREIRAFVPQEYWTVAADLTPDTEEHKFRAEVRAKGEQKIELANEADATAVCNELREATYLVDKVSKAQRKKSPAPPFITSTLQQEASRKLGFTAKQTMRTAQELYEGIELGAEGSTGLITYMRTDSTRVADEAKHAAAELIRARFGADYLPSGARTAKKVKGAQDAHEAIRPTDPHRTPESVSAYLTAQQRKLYELIWNRFIASQMADARYEVTTVDIKAGEYWLRATGSVTLFRGFTAVYSEGTDNGAEEQQGPLPELANGQKLLLLDLIPEQHFTQPPPRYSEATLVKALEQHGIGRPSTYAQILSVIVERKYVTVTKRVFAPTELGERVCDALVKAFPSTFDVRFTAHMEQDLDKIAENGADWVEVVREFYDPMKDQLEQALGIKDRTCPACGRPMVVKNNWRGEFLACSGYPECKETASIGPPPEETEEVCEKCGRPMVIKSGRRGRFLACTGYPECRNAKPLPGEEPRPEPKPTDEVCPECGKPMVIRTGPTGEFLGCTGYPKCKKTLPLPGEEPRVRESDKTCPACGQPMVIRKGRTGEFYACTGYPKCKKTLPMEGETGVPCVVCGEGQMVQRRSKKGRVFYGCSRYPECENTTWDPPTGEKCPVCGGSLVEKTLKSGPVIRCGRKGCTYVKEPVEAAV